MKLLSNILCNLMFFYGICQSIQTDQKLLSNNGATLNNSNGTQITYSIGEVLVFKGTTGSNIYTQGFQQPDKGISFVYQSIPISCLGANDGAIIITEVIGCNEPYILIVNGEIQNNLNIHGLMAGNYLIEVISSNCSSSQELDISEPDSACELHFFNGFSPNNDNSNDDWIIENINAPAFENNSVEIFNRWGDVVWKGENYNNSTIVFSGQDENGNELPDGTYYYFARINLIEHAGFIALLR